MRPDGPNVKRKSRFERQLCWFREHPLTGWYIACLVMFNTFLNLMDALDVDPLWFTH